MKTEFNYKSLQKIKQKQKQKQKKNIKQPFKGVIIERIFIELINNHKHNILKKDMKHVEQFRLRLNNRIVKLIKKEYPNIDFDVKIILNTNENIKY